MKGIPMGYLEDIEKIKQVKLDAAPFLEAVDNGRKMIQECMAQDLPPEAKAQIETALRLIDENRAEFVKAFQEEVPALHQSLHESLDGLAGQIQSMEEENKKNLDYLNNTPQTPDFAEDPSKNPFHPANLVASVPAGPLNLPVTTDLPLSEGEELKKHILSLRNESQSGPRPGSRVSGNIWENWKKPGQ